MIVIKSLDDCIEIDSAEHRRTISDIALDIFSVFYIYPEDTPCIVYIQNKTDDITSGVPHLSDTGRGLLCVSDIWSDGIQQPGWCWEDVRYHDESDLYEILVLVNNELSVGYFIPNDEDVNAELKSAMDGWLNSHHRRTPKAA